MRKLWMSAMFWAREIPLGGGAPGEGEGREVTPEEERGLGREAVRQMEGGASIGRQADPGTLRGDVSFVGEEPENVTGRVGRTFGAVPLTEGGDTSTGNASESGADTGGPGGSQADGASNTGGVGGYPTDL